jgi:hypothetical protein
LVIYHAACVHIGQGRSGQAAALFFLINPCGQGLLENSVRGAAQMCGHLIDSLS